MKLPWESTVFLELGQSSWKVRHGERGLDLPLERQDNGRLTASCKERLASALQSLGARATVGWRPRVICALSVRGVSLRRIALPKTSHEEPRRLLMLQMEREFPLPPEALAWGCCAARTVDSTGVEEWLVAALKREVLADYTEVLSRCGLKPVFTLAALGRMALCSQPDEPYALLDIGRSHSELVGVEGGVLTTARIIPWGGEHVTQTVQTQLGINRDDAEKLKVSFLADHRSHEATHHAVDCCWQTEAETLASLITRQPLPRRIFLTGETARSDLFVAALAQALPGAQIDRVTVRPGAGCSAATLGWQALWARNGGKAPLAFQMDGDSNGEALLRQGAARWAAVAGGLLLALLVVRYGEAVVRQPRLSGRLAQVNSQRAGLPSLDREASFLEYLETNQPPFLDTVWLVANAAPRGARLDSLAMTRRGDFSLRGSMANAEEAAEFRRKLVDSGYFTSVVLDEQAPTPDRQKVTFRLTVQLKPHSQRPSLPAALAGKETGSGKTPGGATNSAAGAPGPRSAEKAPPIRAAK